LFETASACHAYPHFFTIRASTPKMETRLVVTCDHQSKFMPFFWTKFDSSGNFVA
jgi:hypothetical protein